jgi:hypothetical protein
MDFFLEEKQGRHIVGAAAVLIHWPDAPPAATAPLSAWRLPVADRADRPLLSGHPTRFAKPRFLA